jgi:branched-subunit amino acid transport protein AzlD
MSAAETAGDVPKTLDTKPPASVPEAAAAPGGVVIPTEDDYITKLLKYIPIEILGAYLFMQTVVDSNVTTSHAHAIWLLCLLIGSGILTFAYDRWVLSILRKTQLFMSVLAFAVYVFAMGGWFATTGWYHQWYGSIAVPTFVVLVAIIPVGPLPTPNSAKTPASPPTTSATDPGTATAASA